MEYLTSVFPKGNIAYESIQSFFPLKWNVIIYAWSTRLFSHKQISVLRILFH